MASGVIAHKLSKAFPCAGRQTLWALQEVSFELPTGGILIITGKNGAGKTTLLKTFTTLILPTSGSAFVNGYDVIRQALQVRRHIGIALADDRSFYWRLTGKQNLTFFGRLYGLRRNTLEKRMEMLQAHFQIDFLHRPVYSYSAGMRQKLTLVRAFLADAPILLLDEPMRSLDPESSQALIRWLRREKERSKTVVLTTQRWEAAGLDEGWATLQQGRFQWTPPLSDRRQEVAAILR